MKRILSIFLLVLFLSAGASNAFAAENQFFEITENCLREWVDCTDRMFLTMDASGYNPNECVIDFNFTEGNQSIDSIMGDRAMISFFYDDYELLYCLLMTLQNYESISAQLPEGKELVLSLRLSKDEARTDIGLEEYLQYFSLFFAPAEPLPAE